MKAASHYNKWKEIKRNNSFVKTSSLLGELHPFGWNKAMFFAEFKPIVSPLLSDCHHGGKLEIGFRGCTDVSWQISFFFPPSPALKPLL